MNTFQMAKQVMLHPIDFFEDVQGRGRWHQAIIIIVLTVAARFFSLTLSGFFFQTRELYDISILLEALWIVVPWLTWSVTNWGVSTIMDGEGKFKDIFVSSAFVLTPYIVFAVPIAIVSNILSKSEQSLYNGLGWFMMLWIVYLILMQVKIVHDFQLSKMLWIVVLSVIGMFIIWFIGLLIFGIINQTINFLIGLYKEISYRM
jgi:hypothetical protein